MRKRLPRTLLHAAPLAALFALACALLAPVASPARARKAAPRPNQAQTKERPETPPSDSVIYGRAVYDDTSRPVRRARVMLVSDAGARSEYGALTDGDGDFRITGVRAGTYFIFADVPGVLSPVGFISVNELRGNVPDFAEARKFFDVVEVDGKRESRVTVHVRRGGALSGRVVYADGDPAVNVMVNVMRRGAGGRLEKYITGINIIAMSGLRTDDRGMFRVTGLPPGEYLVAVSEQAEHGDPSGGRDRDPMSGIFEGLVNQQFLMTYYPSAVSAKEATVLKVEAGVERADIDITIPDRGLYAVEGVVRGKRDKLPMAYARVTITRRDDDVAVSASGPEVHPGGQAQNSTNADEQGRWHFTQLPDGRYTVTVRPREEYEEAPAEDGEYAVTNRNTRNMNGGGPYTQRRRKKSYAPTSRDVQVSGGDVSEVSVELDDGAQISGTVTFEGAGEDERVSGYVSVRLIPDGGGGAAETFGESWGASASGGVFSVAGLPAGKFSLRPTTYDGANAYVKSITWNGKDLLREPLELAEGASAHGVRIVMSSNPSKLNVRATLQSRKVPARGVTVFLLMPDASQWSPHAEQLSCQTDRDGSCHIAAPPGDYRVVAVPGAGESARSVEGFERRVASAPRVTLVAGEEKTFDLVVPER